MKQQRALCVQLVSKPGIGLQAPVAEVLLDISRPGLTPQKVRVMIKKLINHILSQGDQLEELMGKHFGAVLNPIQGAKTSSLKSAMGASPLALPVNNLPARTLKGAKKKKIKIKRKLTRKAKGGGGGERSKENKRDEDDSDDYDDDFENSEEQEEDEEEEEEEEEEEAVVYSDQPQDGPNGEIIISAMCGSQCRSWSKDVALLDVMMGVSDPSWQRAYNDVQAVIAGTTPMEPSFDASVAMALVALTDSKTKTQAALNPALTATVESLQKDPSSQSSKILMREFRLSVETNGRGFVQTGRHKPQAQMEQEEKDEIERRAAAAKAEANKVDPASLIKRSLTSTDARNQYFEQIGQVKVYELIKYIKIKPPKTRSAPLNLLCPLFVFLFVFLFV